MGIEEVFTLAGRIIMDLPFPLNITGLYVVSAALATITYNVIEWFIKLMRTEEKTHGKETHS